MIDLLDARFLENRRASTLESFPVGTLSGLDDLHSRIMVQSKADEIGEFSELQKVLRFSRWTLRTQLFTDDQMSKWFEVQIKELQASRSDNAHRLGPDASNFYEELQDALSDMARNNWNSLSRAVQVRLENRPLAILTSVRKSPQSVSLESYQNYLDAMGLTNPTSSVSDLVAHPIENSEVLVVGCPALIKHPHIAAALLSDVSIRSLSFVVDDALAQNCNRDPFKRLTSLNISTALIPAQRITPGLVFRPSGESSIEPPEFEFEQLAIDYVHESENDGPLRDGLILELRDGLCIPLEADAEKVSVVEYESEAQHFSLRYVEIFELEEGDIALVKKGEAGEGAYLEKASKAMADTYLELKRLSQYWKQALQEQLELMGRASVLQSLRNRGLTVDADLESWLAPSFISPRSKADSMVLFQFLGMGKPEAERTTNLSFLLRTELRKFAMAERETAIRAMNEEHLLDIVDTGYAEVKLPGSQNVSYILAEVQGRPTERRTFPTRFLRKIVRK